MEEMEAEIKTAITDLVLSCDDDVFEELVDKSVIDVHVTNLSKPLLLQAAIKTWQSIVIHSKISVEQRNILEKLSIKYLLQTIPIMTELSILPNNHLNQRIEIQILDSFVTMLSVDKFLSFKGTMMCLESCFLLRLDEVSDARFFLSFHALYGVLHATLAHHPSSVLRIIPAFLTATKSLLRECILRSDQDKLAGQPVYLDNMVRCANCVSRLLTLFAGHRTELHRVAAYLVSDYANWVKKVTLPPAVKKALLPGVYAFLDLCDKHALSQLRNMLPPGVREVFHLLHNDYLKYFKYTGKI
ncbi:unhealthy ribosome biogenesis protein 2 homolog [Pomacea canaliculata]|uniref:unhealthy ribosome biogenesis protein 2 homolog n=1 Tax=Pomacea canaliculata TaxID=400727 RepID=UPI000D7302D2|nr:unhealthy ribosome biogenesis protein 2 homolog [Pomacea canaliculata]XP_025103020.1 unhealthy ribosome biogenesis protein 2 homolog [Pomacea canaliculata]